MLSSQTEWSREKEELLEQIAKIEAKHKTLKAENDAMEKSMHLHLWQGASDAGDDDNSEIDVTLVQGEIEELLREKQELEVRAKRAKEALVRAKQTEEAVIANHEELLRGFQQLKGALDVDDENARNHLQHLLKQLKQQQLALEKLHTKEEREYTIRAANLAKDVVPGVSAHVQRAIQEERKKIADALRAVEEEAKAKFEAAAKVASDRYAEECEKVLKQLTQEKKKQDALADNLEEQVAAAEANLTKLYSERRNAFRKNKDVINAKAPDEHDLRKLKALRERCRQLWVELKVEPERIVSFLNSVRKASPPDENFYALLCRTAEQLTAKLAIQEALKQRDELLEILADIKAKCLGALQAAKSVVDAAPDTFKKDEVKLDTYVAKNLVKQLKNQYNMVATDVVAVTGRLQRYLADYSLEFDEDFEHRGKPLTAAGVGELKIAGLEKFLPPGW